jgi:hypothetical protein
MDFGRGLRIYTHWRIRNGYLKRGKNITPKEFISSPFYDSFMNLVKFTSENWVITSLRYLDFLIDYRVAEPKWMKEETLKAYREHSRLNDNPIAQTKETFEAIKHWCEKNSVDRHEFFAKVPPGQALQLITTNRLSPWVLFGYDRAVAELLARMNDDWICSVNEFLNNLYWINRIKTAEQISEAIQAECERLFDE